MTTKAERIQKLGRAVREYRGAYNARTGVWFQPPKPSRKEQIEKHLTALDFDVESNMRKIDAFKTLDDYRNWIRRVTAAAISGKKL